MSTKEAQESSRVALESVDLLAQRLHELVTNTTAIAHKRTSDPVRALVRLACMLDAVDAAAVRSLLAGRHVAVSVPGGRMFVDLGDWTSGVILREYAWERLLIPLCRERIASGDTVLDIGAHIGSYAVLFARTVGRSGRVVAFEPVADNVALLDKTIAINGFESFVEVASVALSNIQGTAMLFPYAHGSARAGDRYPSTSSMLHSLVPSDGYAETGVSVPVTTLDEFAAIHNIETAQFIKIDTEGAELRVLEGGRQLIERSPRLSILVEIHPVELAAAGHSIDDVVRWLRDDSMDIIDLHYEQSSITQRRLEAGDRATGKYLLAQKTSA